MLFDLFKAFDQMESSHKSDLSTVILDGNSEHVAHFFYGNDL